MARENWVTKLVKLWRLEAIWVSTAEKWERKKSDGQTKTIWKQWLKRIHTFCIFCTYYFIYYYIIRYLLMLDAEHVLLHGIYYIILHNKQWLYISSLYLSFSVYLFLNTAIFIVSWACYRGIGFLILLHPYVMTQYFSTWAYHCRT